MESMNLTINIGSAISECKQGSDLYQTYLENVCDEIVEEFNDMYIEQLETKDILDFVDMDIKGFAVGERIDTRAHYVRNLGDLYFVYRKRTVCSTIDDTKVTSAVAELCDVVLGAERNTDNE